MYKYFIINNNHLNFVHWEVYLINVLITILEKMIKLMTLKNILLKYIKLLIKKIKHSIRILYFLILN